MKIAVIYGNPKSGGFVHECLDFVAVHCEGMGVETERLRLAEKRIGECVGCFTCLRTGICPQDDDVPSLIRAIDEADGILTGASVRNGYFPALFKRFYERITYLVGFTRLMRGKASLAIGAVGMAGGKKHLGRMITFRDFMAIPSGYLFFRTGIPGRLAARDVEGRLVRAANRFVERLFSPRRPSVLQSLKCGLDNATIRRFMLRKNPDGVYDYIIKVWREKGMMK